MYVQSYLREQKSHHTKYENLNPPGAGFANTNMSGSSATTLYLVTSRPKDRGRTSAELMDSHKERSVQAEVVPHRI